jgi:ABC-type polysaccharide/polyol phosphate transport system ATPase subunit
MNRSIKVYPALKNISFSLNKGEVLGLIGSNGAGKSTLLKLLSGVMNPTSGFLSLDGTISSILEISTGFSPFLTGRENIHRRLLMYGVTRKKRKQLEPEIIEFSELSDVIDRPVRTYSSGMAAKLAFAIVTSNISSILLIDELIVVGDQHFQGRSFSRIKDVCSSGRTVVIASHSIEYVEKLCDKAIWLEDGCIKEVGTAHAVCMSYLGKNIKKARLSYPREYAFIKDVNLNVNNDYFLLQVVIERIKLGDDLHFQIAIHDSINGTLAALLNTKLSNTSIPNRIGEIKFSVRIKREPGMIKGLLGFVIIKGDFREANHVLDDAWGWDTGDQKYFYCLKDHTAYLSQKAEWKICI